MQIIHPQGSYNGFPPEDVFIAVDDLGTELGRGYIICLFQPHLYPDCPVNLYFSLKSQPVARYLLFGALAARARQLRDFFPGIPARLYTDVAPNDAQMRDFYTHSGFHFTNAEKLLLLEKPVSGSRLPMSLSVVQTDLQTPEAQQAFVARMQQNDLTFVTLESLYEMMRKPHFISLSLYRNEYLVGEILACGQGDACEINAVYVEASNRRQGMASFLIHRTLEYLASRGVTYFTTRVMTHSPASCRLMQHFNAKVQDTYVLYPHLQL